MPFTPDIPGRRPKKQIVQTGPRGAEGSAGPQGPIGPKGETGPQGAVGPRGATGARGETGPTGAVGAEGKSVVGPAGQSVTGPMGPVGPSGAKGDRGPVGAQGVPGPEGPTGPIGSTGSRGELGPKGDAGSPGPTGPVGNVGPEGTSQLQLTLIGVNPLPDEPFQPYATRACVICVQGRGDLVQIGIATRAEGPYSYVSQFSGIGASGALFVPQGGFVKTLGGRDLLFTLWVL